MHLDFSPPLRLESESGRPGEVRPEWEVLVDLGARLGLDLERHVSAGAILAADD